MPHDIRIEGLLAEAFAGDVDAVRARCEAFTQALAAEEVTEAELRRLGPALQWAAEYLGLSGYAMLFNLPSDPDAGLSVADDSDLPAAVGGLLLERLAPGASVERREQIDLALAEYAVAYRSQHGMPEPAPRPLEGSTVFPRGFASVLPVLRSRSHETQPVYTASLVVPETPGEEIGEEPGDQEEPTPEEKAEERDVEQLLETMNGLEDWSEEEWNEPAAEHEIEGLESALGVTLPEEYKDFLRIHNGSADREFVSTEEAAEVSEELLDAYDLAEDDPDIPAGPANLEEGTGRLRDGYFLKGWVPFYDYGTGAFDLLDCVPGPRGVHGQVIRYTPAPGDGVVYGGFGEWLEHHVAEMEDDEP